MLYKEIRANVAFGIVTVLSGQLQDRPGRLKILFICLFRLINADIYSFLLTRSQPGVTNKWVVQKPDPGSLIPAPAQLITSKLTKTLSG